MNRANFYVTPGCWLQWLHFSILAGSDWLHHRLKTRASTGCSHAATLLLDPQFLTKHGWLHRLQIEKVQPVLPSAANAYNSLRLAALLAETRASTGCSHAASVQKNLNAAIAAIAATLRKKV